MRQQFKVLKNKAKRSGRLQEVALFDENGSPFSVGPIPSAILQCSSADGPLVHDVSWRDFPWTMGAVSDPNLFALIPNGVDDATSGGILSKKPGLYKAELSIEIDMGLGDPAKATEFGLAIVEQEANNTYIGGWNGKPDISWGGFSVSANLELGAGSANVEGDRPADSMTLNGWYELKGSADQAINWSAVFRVWRLGDLAERPELTPLA